MSLRGFGSKCLREVEAFLEAHKAHLYKNELGTKDLQTISRPESLEDLLSLLVKFPLVRRRLQQVADPNVDLILDTIARCQRKVEQQIAEGTYMEGAFAALLADQLAA